MYQHMILHPTNSVTVYNAIAAGYMKWVWDRLASRDFTLRIATFLMAPSSVWLCKTWTVTGPADT